MGGEKFTAYAKIWNEWGSPPRGRGIGDNIRRLCQVHRITPAWAGKSQGHRADRGAEQDHPRMGGEKKRADGLYIDPTGSPPRGRGKERAWHTLALEGGITPRGRGKVPEGRTAPQPPRITPARAGKSPFG